VVRPAVAAALSKRLMDHKISKCRGFFVVDALSGVDLYEDQSHRFDSKVVLIPPPDDHDVQIIGKPATKKHSEQHRLAPSCNAIEYSPLPSEVAADDVLIQSVKQMSASETTKYKALCLKEESEMKRAELESLVMQRKYEEELGDDSDDEECKKVLVLSKEEEMARHRQEEDEQKEIERILALSKSPGEETNDEMLQYEYALSISAQQHARDPGCVFDEDDIRRALEESLADFMRCSDAS